MRTSNTVSPLRQRMIEDMTARNLGHHTQRSHIYSCKRFAAFLKRSPDTATREELRLFQLQRAPRIAALERELDDLHRGGGGRVAAAIGAGHSVHRSSSA